METNFIGLVIGIVSLPLQLVQLVVFTLMNFLVFDLLQLGPYLPIQF